MYEFYSHSVVPGGFEVKSYKTRVMPSIEEIARTILSMTWKGISNSLEFIDFMNCYLRMVYVWLDCTCCGSFPEPGTIGSPVMKSFVSNGRKTIEREHDGIRLTGSRSKWTGINTTGICEIFDMQPLCCKIYGKFTVKIIE